MTDLPHPGEPLEQFSPGLPPRSRPAGRSRDEPAVTAERDIFRLPATVLFILGILDLIRGVMHTFLLRWAGVHVAGFDPVTTPPDQFFMLGAFGISNFLTGFLYLLISRKARELSPYVLAIIPATYLLGMIGIGVANVNPQAVFAGKYFMTVYLALCVATVAVFLAQRGAHRKSS